MSGTGPEAPDPSRAGSAVRTPPGPEDLYASPNALAPDYSRFRVSERLLLTGHSHQAWPDCGFEGQRRAWLDAAERVDEKWERAFERAERVRRGYRRLLDGTDGPITLGVNTHELVVRFLSALPLAERPRLVTTDAEFHTIRRQLDRLAEEGIEIAKVPAHPAAEAGQRVAEAVDEGTAAALVSSVFYTTGHIAGGLAAAAAACRRSGARLLVDAYHSLNALPFSLDAMEDAFVVGGGYKYCQLGEGNCFLRVPPDCDARPVISGWFSEFSTLEEAEPDGRVPYGRGPDRFAGSTYDPTSHYRAAEVFAFFRERGLDPDLLREVSRHQVGLLAEGVDALDADPAVLDRDRSVPLEQVGGFLALRTPYARELCEGLRARGVRSDWRDERLRLGPAPYLSDRQLRDALSALSEALASVGAELSAPGEPADEG